MEPVPEDMKVSTLVPKDPGVLRLVGPGGRGSDALERRVPRRPAISDASEVSETDSKQIEKASPVYAVAKATWWALHQPWGVWFAYVRPHGPAERTRGDYRQHDEDEDEGCGQDSEDRGGLRVPPR